MSTYISPGNGTPIPASTLWWLAVAGAIGLVIPTIVGVGTAVLSYYPLVAFLGIGVRLTGTFLSIVVVGILVVSIGTIYCPLTRNWQRFFFSVVLVGGLIFGFRAGIAAYFHLESEGFKLLSDRSVALVQAIETYQRDTGAAPPGLAALVPQYLPSIPHTRMAAYPDYEYEVGSGMCPKDNAWNVYVLAGEGLSFDMFLYCPKKNYPPNVGGNWAEVIGDWAYVRD